MGDAVKKKEPQSKRTPILIRIPRIREEDPAEEHDIEFELRPDDDLELNAKRIARQFIELNDDAEFCEARFRRAQADFNGAKIRRDDFLYRDSVDNIVRKFIEEKLRGLKKKSFDTDLALAGRGDVIVRYGTRELPLEITVEDAELLEKHFCEGIVPGVDDTPEDSPFEFVPGHWRLSKSGLNGLVKERLALIEEDQKLLSKGGAETQKAQALPPGVRVTKRSARIYIKDRSR